MTAIGEKAYGSRNFPHGLHPPERKSLAADAPVEVVDTPAKVLIPLLQHTGAPASPTVKMRDEVALGDQLAAAAGFISASVHASIAGTVQKQTVATLPNGRHVPALPIKAGEQTLTGAALWEDTYGGEWDFDAVESCDGEQIATAVAEAGVVGLGGAAFPTHVKLTYNENKPIDTILVNGCECEPYLTADYRLMLQAPRASLAGALLAARANRARRVVVAIEDNKPLAIEAMTRAAAGTDVEVLELPTKYPMGGEKQTILASLGRKVPTGGLPLDVGVVVINVGTAAAVARAVLRGKPLTHRIVTVSGRGVKRPANLLAPIGISYGELIDHCGGFSADEVRVVGGGPMTGFAVGWTETPVTKGTSGVTVLTGEEVARPPETPCVRCGRCVDVCPVALVPTKIAAAARHKDWDLARKYQVLACIECGCCGYVCPAAIPLPQLIRAGKAELPRE